MQPLTNAVMAASTSAPNFSSSAVTAMPLSPGKPTDAAPFSDLFTNAVGQVSQLEDQARVAVDGLMAGTGVDVHQAMIATQKASMAFELALAVRNKAVQAYQQVIGMQF